MAPAARAIALLTAIAVAAAGGGPALTPARAQDSVTRGMPVIRDAEIEQLLRDYAQPVLRAAGLAKQNVRVVVLSDRSFNAFVMDGRHIFINAGALFDAKTPNEIIGIFAHETGHLAGGHLQRLREQLATAQTAGIVALLAGLGAAVAASRAGAGGDVGAAAIMAPQSAIMRSVLAYVRTQEDQADHAGVKFLNATSQSPKGMVDLFKRLSNEMLFNSRYIDPYMQTHPMPADRVAALEALAKASPYWDKKDPPELQLRHDMMRAKLSGFLERPETVARRYPASDHGLPARYARAIATYRNADLRQALVQIDALIQAQPNNPYFYELKGQGAARGWPAG
jgi:predicted Zn-dependent protease